MGSKVTFDYSKADAFISAHEMESMKKITEAAKAELLGREGAGNDFLGWIDLPVDLCNNRQSSWSSERTC